MRDFVFKGGVVACEIEPDEEGFRTLSSESVELVEEVRRFCSGETISVDGADALTRVS